MPPIERHPPVDRYQPPFQSCHDDGMSYPRVPYRPEVDRDFLPDDLARGFLPPAFRTGPGYINMTVGMHQHLLKVAQDGKATLDDLCLDYLWLTLTRNDIKRLPAADPVWGCDRDQCVGLWIPVTEHKSSPRAWTQEEVDRVRREVVHHDWPADWFWLTQPLSGFPFHVLSQGWVRIPTSIWAQYGDATIFPFEDSDVINGIAQPKPKKLSTPPAASAAEGDRLLHFFGRAASDHVAAAQARDEWYARYDD